MRTTTTTVKTICDECGADMTSEPKTAATPAIATVNKKDFRVTTKIESVSRAGDSSYDLCQKCRTAILTTASKQAVVEPVVVEPVDAKTTG